MLSSFSLGITLPVMNLVLLESGATLSSLALLMGAYSAIIVLTEIPSGMVSDRYGRKAAFLISKVVTLFGSFILILGNSTVTLFLAILLLGIARSFVSGSFEALTIDWHNREYGIERLAKIMTSISIWETLGLSAGALSAGFISIAFQHSNLLENYYGGTFLVSGALQVLIVLFTLLWIKEPLKEETRCTTFREISKGFLHIGKDQRLIALFVLTFAIGCILSGIEKYWQPRLLQLSQTKELASIFLGVLVFMGFMGAMLGSLFAGYTIQRFPKLVGVLIILFRLIMLASLGALALARTTVMFSIAYSLFYLFLGLSQIPEQTMFNRAIPEQTRASMLSFSSFFLQIGGLVSSLFAAIWLSHASRGISSLWITLAVVGIVSLLPLIRVLRKRP